MASKKSRKQSGDFASFESEWKKYSEALKKANVKNKKTVFDALAAANITTVTVSFDGEGDSGQVNAVDAFVGNRVMPLPGTVIPLRIVPSYKTKIIVNEEDLNDAIVQLCYAYLEQEHGGWENNDGAYGEFRFDVAARTIDLEFSGRITDVHTENHTF